MELDPLKDRALDLLLESMNDFAATAKLQFGLSTGALVLFVHVMVESHEGPLPVGILTIASIFFGLSAIRCIEALIHWSVMKRKIALSLSGTETPLGGEGRGDVFRRLAKEQTDGATVKFGRMSRFFYAGVAWSVVFLLVQFVLRLRHS